MSKELAEAVKLFISQPLNNPLTRGQIMEVARIALPILEQQERGEGWIEWRGIHQPVNDSVVVRVKYRSGRQAEDSAACFNWGNSGSIIAYRIIPEHPTNQNGEAL